MKIYQTTEITFDYSPVNDITIPRVLDIADDIILNADMNEALSVHKEIVDFHSDEDIFYITNVDNKVNIDNDDIYLRTVVERVTDDYITRVVIETVTREIE